MAQSLGDARRHRIRSSASGADLDVLVTGRLFYEMVFAGLERLPGKGEEVYASECVTCPGGAATRAVACSRLGLMTRLSTAFGDDLEGKSCWSFLLTEGIDLSTSYRYTNWRTPVTVSAALDQDRAMLTYASTPPESYFAGLQKEGESTSVLVELDPLGEMTLSTEMWLKTARDANAKIFATTATAFDPKGRWQAGLLSQLDGVHAVILNETEALRYSDAGDLKRALGVLSGLVPVAIVTRGAHGAMGHDAATGETVEVPAIATIARDTTGAGDIFAAAIVYGTLHAWPLTQRLAFASLCSHIAIQRTGSSVSCPSWDDIGDWWSGAERDMTGANSPEEMAAIRGRYAFLADLVMASADL
jgi:sugar/nucleoside kinase (ribokinase family)